MADEAAVGGKLTVFVAVAVAAVFVVDRLSLRTKLLELLRLRLPVLLPLLTKNYAG